jgi:hypothetical protein
VLVDGVDVLADVGFLELPHPVLGSPEPVCGHRCGDMFMWTVGVRKLAEELLPPPEADEVVAVGLEELEVVVEVEHDVVCGTAAPKPSMSWKLLLPRAPVRYPARPGSYLKCDVCCSWQVET